MPKPHIAYYSRERELWIFAGRHGAMLATAYEVPPDRVMDAAKQCFAYLDLSHRTSALNVPARTIR